MEGKEGKEEGRGREKKRKEGRRKKKGGDGEREEGGKEERGRGVGREKTHQFNHALLESQHNAHRGGLQLLTKMMM